MSYKSDLSKEDLVRWEEFKDSIKIDRKERIFGVSADLGKCHVRASFMDGELYFEIMPSETSDLEGDVEGVIVNVDENKCHLDSLLKMHHNAKTTEKAKMDKKPIKKFTNSGGIKIHQ